MEIRSCTCNQLPFLYVDLQSQGGVSYLNDSSVFPAERDHKIIIGFIKIKITMNPSDECKRLLHWKAQSQAPPAKPNHSQRETQISVYDRRKGIVKNKELRLPRRHCKLRTCRRRKKRRRRRRTSSEPATPWTSPSSEILQQNTTPLVLATTFLPRDR